MFLLLSVTGEGGRGRRICEGAFARGKRLPHKKNCGGFFRRVTPLSSRTGTQPHSRLRTAEGVRALKKLESPEREGIEMGDRGGGGERSILSLSTPPPVCPSSLLSKLGWRSRRRRGECGSRGPRFSQRRRRFGSIGAGEERRGVVGGGHLT